MKPAVLPAVLAMLAFLATPAQAFEFSYGGEMRLGVIYERDRESGESRMRPGGGAALNMQLSRQFDNGITLTFGLGIEADNLQRPRPPWTQDPAHPRN